MDFIGKIIEMIKAYKYCTVEDYKCAMTEVKEKFNKEIDAMIRNVDTNCDGMVSVGEAGNQIWKKAKLLIKLFKTNSKDFWK